MLRDALLSFIHDSEEKKRPYRAVARALEALGSQRNIADLSLLKTKLETKSYNGIIQAGAARALARLSIALDVDIEAHISSGFTDERNNTKKNEDKKTTGVAAPDTASTTPGEDSLLALCNYLYKFTTWQSSSSDVRPSVVSAFASVVSQLPKKTSQGYVGNKCKFSPSSSIDYLSSYIACVGMCFASVFSRHLWVHTKYHS